MDISKKSHEVQKKYYLLAKQMSKDPQIQAKIFILSMDAFNEGMDTAQEVYQEVRHAK